MNNSVETYTAHAPTYLPYEKWRNCLRVGYLIRIPYISCVIRPLGTRDTCMCACLRTYIRIYIAANNNSAIILQFIIDFCREEPLGV